MNMEKWKDFPLLRVVRTQNETNKCDVWAPLKHGTYLFGIIGTTGEPYDVMIDPMHLPYAYYVFGIAERG